MLDAYWPGAGGVPWAQIGSALSVAFGAASPVLLLVLQGRQKREDYREKVAETAQERVDRISREEFAHVAADRDRYRALLYDEERAHADTKHDRDEGWDAGRGMEQWAHDQRHIYANLLMNARSLWLLLDRVAQGQLPANAIAALLSQAETLPSGVTQVPPLRDVQRKKPNEADDRISLRSRSQPEPAMPAGAGSPKTGRRNHG